MCGWCGANNNGRTMKIKNFTGFMLGNENSVHLVGMPWMDFDAHVWVCPNLAKAKKVLVESQRRMNIEPGAIWTMIYQVSGRDVVFEQANNGLLYTDVPTKIYVDRVVLHQRPEMITEDFLQKNAQILAQSFDFVTGRKK